MVRAVDSGQTIPDLFRTPPARPSDKAAPPAIVDPFSTPRSKATSDTEPAIVDPFAGRSTPTATGDGHLTINCRPTCERLVLDGTNLGPSPVVKHPVRPGEHVVVGHRGKSARRAAVVVEAGRTRSLVLDMDDLVNPFAEDTGRVAVVCTPVCERVLVDGRNIGASPISGYRLPAGPHDFVFVRGKERKQRRVVVQAGKIFRISVLMSRSLPADP